MTSVIGTFYGDKVLQQRKWRYAFRQTERHSRRYGREFLYLSGRIICSVRSRSAVSAHRARISARLFSSMIKASLHPVRIPRYIFTPQSFKGVPTDSILRLILCSIGERITHDSEEVNAQGVAVCFTKTLICSVPA